MKTLTAILFLAILVFNFYGYRLVISSLQQNSSAAIEAKVDDRQYSDEDLVSIKTVLNLPYYINSAGFERAYGSVTINGKDYEYVKRRVHNDTLELLCLPNHKKTDLREFGNEMTKATADGQASSPLKKTGTTLKITLPDFCSTSKNHLPVITFEIKQVIYFYNPIFISANFTSRPERPPAA